MIPALILFIIHAHSDYTLQADAHGWKSWLDLSYRAPKPVKYVASNFFGRVWAEIVYAVKRAAPLDPWHFTQNVRNQSVLVAAILTMQAPQFWIIPNWVMVFALYAVGRAIGFSAFVKWMAKR